MQRLPLAIVIAALAILATPATALAAPPTGVTAFAGSGRVDLSWQPEAGATSYQVYRGTSATAITTPLAFGGISPPSVGQTATYADTTAVNGTTYHYVVRAVVGGTESADSRMVRATPRARTCSGNPVTQENCTPGDSDWEVALTNVGIEGFATEQSVDRGGSFDVKVKTTAAYDLEIFRSGWYGGAGARLVSVVPNIAAQSQPSCTNDAGTGLVDCAGWSVAQTITTSTAWPSGIYLIRLKRRDTGNGTHVLIVVRDDGRSSDILYGLPTSTYQAYNAWGGRSLYDYNSTGANTVAGARRAVKVSYDRPYYQPNQDSERNWYSRNDITTVWWLERSGYDVAYAAVTDLERNGALARNHRAYLSGEHDEYWSAAMRTAAQQARDAGTDLFFTGSNEVYWKIRFEPSPVSGRQDRVQVCYKSTQSGPADPTGIPTGTWRDPAGANLPENALTGVQYIGDHGFNYFPLRVTAAQGKDRIWRYTGLDAQATGATASVGSQLVGWEWDARASNGFEPAGVTTLAASPVTGGLLTDAGRNYADGSAVANMVKYTAASGALVVTTGTNHWTWGLERNILSEGEPNAKIQQATTNILADMGAVPETPASGIILDDPSAPPLLVQRTPATSATGVEPAASVRAVFSRPMDGSTITGSSFTLHRPDGSQAPATVSYDDLSFTTTLTPTAPLSLSTAHTVRLAASVKAANGVPLGSDIAWSFTTRDPDTTPPAVTVTSPAAGTTVSGTVTLAATASDDTAVAGVRFKLDGNDIGAEDTTAPYSIAWDSSAAANGNHVLTAVARDTSGNTKTSTGTPIEIDRIGLVAAYGFDETAGTTALDSSPKTNTGTVSGATRTTAGRFGGALTFDGVNDWVTVPDSSSLDLSTAMTLEAWVNPSSQSSWRTAVLKEQPNQLVYALYSNTDQNRPSAHVYTDGDHDTRGTGAIPLNAWTHLAATYDGATLRFYVGGTLVSSASYQGSIVNSSGALRIGGNAVWDEWFAGRIDEVRVYRRVLSMAEIQADMANPVVPVVPDTTAPTAPTSLTAADGLFNVHLDWNAASDDRGVTKYTVHRSTTAGFVPSAANKVAETTTATTWTDSGLAPGDYRYRVVAEDAAGNRSAPSAEVTGTAEPDTTAPAVSVSAPADGATVAGTINVTATASDDVGVSGVQFRLDGNDLGAEDTNSPYSASWNTTGVPDGSHTLTAVARDAAGNTRTSATVTVTVKNTDTEQPAVSLTAPAGGATVNGAISVTASASDDVGVSGVQFRLDGANLGAEDTGSPYSTSWNTTNVADGSHTLTAVARDAAGNTRTSTGVTVTVKNTDTAAPSVALTAPTGGTVSGTVNVTASASDDVGVSGVQFRLDGANLGSEDTSSPYSTSWNTATATNGSHTLSATARDAAGNTRTATNVAVTVSNAPATGGLVAAYGFEEASGTSTADSSGSGNTGTLVGGPTRAATGRIGRALSFDGSNDQVTAPNSASLALTSAVTLEAWINPTTLSSWRTVIMKEQPGDLLYAMYANSASDRPEVDVFTNNSRWIFGPSKLPTGAWTHLAMTYDATTLRMYVNGTLVSSGNLGGNIRVANGLLRIGGNSIWGEWYRGLIDEVRVYNRVLSAAEITADMTRPVVGP